MLYDRDHHDWKIITYFINKYLGENFHFHSNLSLNLALVDSLFDSLYYFVSNSEVPSCIQYNFLRCNIYIYIY